MDSGSANSERELLATAPVAVADVPMPPYGAAPGKAIAYAQESLSQYFQPNGGTAGSPGTFGVGGNTGGYPAANAYGGGGGASGNPPITPPTTPPGTPPSTAPRRSKSTGGGSGAISFGASTGAAAGFT